MLRLSCMRKRIDHDNREGEKRQRVSARARDAPEKQSQRKKERKEK